MKLYALWDKKAAALSSFHVEKSDAVASRGFAEAVNQPNSVFGKYPQDFSLVAVAFVNEEAVGVPVEGIAMEEILSAAQVVALRPSGDGQLSLLKEG